MKTLIDLVNTRLSDNADREGVLYRDGGTWTSITWGEFHARARALAAKLMEQGLQKGERVSILSGTRYEWALIDTAILLAGGATITIYPSSTGRGVGDIGEGQNDGPVDAPQRVEDR